jgi:predicted flap endonuclease-1-like 5' DNA nuclease
MRSDVTLYIVAAFFFALTIVSVDLFSDMNRLFWIALSLTLGIIFIGAGYSQRPKAKQPIKTLPATTDESTPAESTTQEAPVEEAPVEDSSFAESVSVDDAQTVEAHVEDVEVISEAPMVSSAQEEQVPAVTVQEDNTAVSAQVEPKEDQEMPLTNVKGVREKRAAQLNALGIHTVKELSQTSVENLTKNLRPISQKQAADLIEAAKQYLKQA